MKFTINSAPAQTTKKCAGLLRLEAACRARKNGELITLGNLAVHGRMSIFTAGVHVKNMDQTLRVRQGAAFYYGNKKTIAAYRKKIQG